MEASLALYIFLGSSHSATTQIVAQLTEALDTALVYLQWPSYN